MKRSRLSSFLRYLSRLALVAIAGILLCLLLFRGAAGLREVERFSDDLNPSGQMIPTAEGSFFLLNKGDPANPLVLFAHGTAAWSGLWEPTLEAAATRGFYAVGFDMPPFGFSEHAADGDYSRSRQADRVIALLSALPQKPIMVAHSVGAGPVAEAVLRRPDLVSGLIIVAGAIGLGSHETPKSTPFFLKNATLSEVLVSATASNPLLTGRFLRNFMYNKDAATPQIVEGLKRPMSRSGYTGALAKWVPQLFVPPIDALSTRAETWRDLDVATALIWGDKDDVTPLAQGEALAALIPGAKLLVLPDVGHIPQIENVEEFRAALFETLRFVTD